MKTKYIVLCVVFCGFLVTANAMFQRAGAPPVGGVVGNSEAVAALNVDSDGNLQVELVGGSGATITINDGAKVRTTPAMSGYTTDFEYGLAPIVSVSTTTTITSTTTLVQEIYANNTTAGAITLTIANSAGTQAVSAYSIPANSNLTLDWPTGITFTNGMSATASASNAINIAVRGKQ